MAEAFDVVMHVENSFSFYQEERKVSFLPACANGVRRLARVVLSEGYRPVTEFERLALASDLMTAHRIFAFQLLGHIGRKTDLAAIRPWTEDAMLGRHAIAAAKSLESMS